MRDKIRVTLETGCMIELVHPSEFGDDIIETPCLIPFHHPRWDGTQWVEGGVQPEPVVTVGDLVKQLQDTDYKIIKCSEYQLAGLELPYDIQALHQERQALRDKINEINE